jgi:IS5 family transposase
MKSRQPIGQDVRFDNVPEGVTGPSAPVQAADGEGTDRRQSVIDRRSGLERRQQARADSGYKGSERRISQRRVDTGLERRRGPGRRLSDDRRAAEEGEMTAHQFEFVMAIETYKKVNKRMYPTWTEVLEVIQQLGYRKVAAREINLENVPEPDLAKVA